MASLRHTVSAQNTDNLHPASTIIVCVALQHGLKIDDVTTERCFLAVALIGAGARIAPVPDE